MRESPPQVPPRARRPACGAARRRHFLRRRGVGASAASATPAIEGAPNHAALLSAVVDEMTRKGPSSDRRFFDGALWLGVGSDCWSCRVAPAVGIAALAPDRPDLLPVATTAIDTAIARHRRPDGSFGDPLETTWFANTLGMSEVLLGPYLDPATKARWTDALVGAANNLIGTGHLSYYVNGNINLSITHTLWLAAHITGYPQFAQAYETSLAFTLSPPQGAWNGYGLRLITNPTRPDGADGAGYLAESNGGAAPGSIRNTPRPSSTLPRSLYVLSRDPRVMRLMNLVMNSLLNRVDKTSALDSRFGTRRSGRVPFLTPALSLLVNSGTRPDLEPRLPAQFARRGDYACAGAD